MISLVRPILVSLLCGMIAVGHAPAWLHLADCESHAHAVAPKAATSVAAAACPHGCHEHAEQGATPDDKQEALPHGGGHDHDSETCVICQSLVAPTGVHWQLQLALAGDVAVDDANVDTAFSIATVSVSIPQPRGPPTPGA